MQPEFMKKLKAVVTFPVDPNYRVAVERAVLDECYPVHRLVGCVILIFQAVMMGASFLQGGSFESPRRIGYLCLYAALFLVTLVNTVLARYLRRVMPERVNLYLNFTTLYAVLLSLWSSGISLLDQYNSGSGLSVFTYVNMSIAVFIVMRPWQSIMVFGGSCLFLNLMVVALRDNPLFFQQEPKLFGTVINSLFMTVMAVIVSITFGHYRIKRHFDKKLIEEQYQEICVINQQLNRLAMTDQLTEMGNRRFLDEEFHNLAQKGGERMTGMMLDIDFFKQFNDHFGHQAGDVCLQEISAVIRDYAQREGAFVVRYGGEEFFVCLPGERDAWKEAEGLRALVEARQVARNDMPCGCVTVSIGVDVEEDWSAIGQDEFLRRCDHALYEAKNSGRNRVALYHDPAERGACAGTAMLST